MTSPFRHLRNSLRDRFFGFLSKALAADDGRRAAVESLRGLLDDRPAPLNGSTHAPAPYADLGKAAPDGRTCARNDLVFITGRFRSGSTLLWNIFRHLEGWTAYYEPFNERRWFDPATRGDRLDGSHRGVTDYWREYGELPELDGLYDQAWIERNLYMPGDFWNPQMKEYIETLVEKAQGRPALQFNRVDFRLPWLRRNFPMSKVVHIYRHPRDQWCSALMGSQSFPHADMPAAKFADSDHLYLRSWCRDLKYHFPFLDERQARHPYQLFYYLWKLSYLYGVEYGDCSISFESLVQRPQETLGQVFRAIGHVCHDWDSILRLIDPPRLERWRAYAPDEWFREHEGECEQVLSDFLADFAGRRSTT